MVNQKFNKFTGTASSKFLQISLDILFYNLYAYQGKKNNDNKNKRILSMTNECYFCHASK